MIYNSSVVEPVKSEFATRRAMARRAIAERREEIYSKLPRVKEIDTEIESTGIKITKLALNGNENIDKAIEDLKETTKKLKAEKRKLITDAGFPENYMTDVYACNICKDTGTADGQMCECFKKELIKNSLKLSNIAPSLAKITFDDFDINCYPDAMDEAGNNPRCQIKNILEHCFEFIKNFGTPKNKNLLFFGDTGLGKTFVTAAVANEVSKKGHSIMYYTARELFGMLTDNAFSSDADLKQEGKWAYNVDLLIIDDLGSENVNQYTAASFFDILNARLISGKQMIINSNLSISELKNTYSSRIFSRLTDFNILKFIGDDIRVQRNIKGE